MKTIEVTIKLDPVNDGVEINPTTLTKKEEGALIIATNGESKIISDVDAVDIMDALADEIQGEFMGRSNYLVVFNGKKVIKVGGKEYFIGSALIVKNTYDGIGMLSGDDFEEAASEFEGKLITLVGDGQEFSAYELA